MAGNTPKRMNLMGKETRERLERCWKEDIDWDLYPEPLKQGLIQVGTALNVPPTAVLASLVSLCGFIISPSMVQVDGTGWKEPVLIWECICMPTGAGKSPLCSYIHDVLCKVKHKVTSSVCWEVGDATFEIMGQLMHRNSCRIIGIYDELTTFLTQLNVYQGKGLSSSHELSLFLQLYNGHGWHRSTVAGDANFNMASTNLTLAGFTQPAVARNLIENAANFEKGLPQRFLWMFPKPSYAHLDSLQPVDAMFTTALVELFSKNYRKKGDEIIFHVAKDNKDFEKAHNTLQDQLKALGGTDDLLCGMLSKSKGQALRVAAVLHVLFQLHMANEDEDHGEAQNSVNMIADAALCAAVDFVETSTQHAAYIAGKDAILTELEKAQSSADVLSPHCDDANVESFTLLQPGKKLDISALVKAKRYKGKGNKSGAVEACKKLQDKGFGNLLELGSSRGTPMKYMFEKLAIPTETEERTTFAEKLATIGVSLSSYSLAYDPNGEPPAKKARAS